MAQRRKSGKKRKSRSTGTAMCDVLYGLHTAEAALGNPDRQIISASLTRNAAERMADLLEKRNITPTLVDPAALTRQLGRDAVHQGVLLEAEPLAEPDPDVLLAAIGAGDKGPLIILDQVTDPHNVGAILRSAAAFEAGGLLVTRRHSPPLGGVLAKSASGAIEHVPVVRVANLARAMESVADTGITRVGFDSDATENLATAPLDTPCALVMGAEGKGLRRLTREHCDILCRIETGGVLASLNVSNAAAIALHACWQARSARKP